MGIVKLAPASITFGSVMPFAFAMSQIPTPAVAAIEASVSPSWIVSVEPAAVVLGAVPLDGAVRLVLTREAKIGRGFKWMKEEWWGG